MVLVPKELLDNLVLPDLQDNQDQQDNLEQLVGLVL